MSTDMKLYIFISDTLNMSNVELCAMILMLNESELSLPVQTSLFDHNLISRLQ